MGHGTQTRLRGMCIIMVVLGHSVLQIFQEASFNEQIVLVTIAKFCAPSLLIFVFLIGYGQGRKKHRIRRSELSQRFQQLMIPYLIWASIAFLFYLLIESPYRYTLVGEAFITQQPYIIRYLFSISTFTISMQYYFLPVLFFFHWYAYMIRIQSEYLMLLIFKYVFIVQWLFLLSVSLFAWFVSPEQMDFGILGGGFLYRNFLVWGTFFYIGYVMGACKRASFPDLKHKGILFLFLWAISATEMIYVINRSADTFVTDMFTLFGVLFAMISLLVWLSVAEKTEEGRSASIFPWAGKVFMLFGKYSFVVFLLHLPFQWYILVLLEFMAGYTFSIFARLAILFFSGIGFPYTVINMSRRIKPMLRRKLIGF